MDIKRIKELSNRLRKNSWEFDRVCKHLNKYIDSDLDGDKLKTGQPFRERMNELLSEMSAILVELAGEVKS